MLMLLAALPVWAEEALQAGPGLPYGVIEPPLLAVCYGGTETFRYEISYTGGIKLGELSLELKAVEDSGDIIEIHALVTTEGGVFNTIYPVRDYHVTRVRGQQRLPFVYEVWQKEGYRYRAHKVTDYDQRSGLISYRKNDRKPVEYRTAVPVHNEFSAFFASRLMRFNPGTSFLVPTFADKRRAEVEVMVLEKSIFDGTAIGSVEVYRVSPILPFRGLYDKRGETTIWFTADDCRVPVRINAKLAIGSVTANLLSYDNPRCGRYQKSSALGHQARAK